MYTFNPGTEPNHAAKSCECCAPTEVGGPLGPRNTIGTLIFPPDI